ncbi:MAG: HAD hydrolase-like protein [Candidatus Moranbacteria bacterium]|jgi:phosphoglycolate phosphatase-like HAD superfamily hydrolase|nr:HAD hydrolase-like protein [Candidatus Moranbacteria bacterium]
MQKRIKKIGLDFDGVIVASNHNFADEFITIGKNMTGREILAEDIFSIWGLTLSDLLEKLYPEISLSVYFQERERLGFHRNFPTLIPGVIQALESISTKIPISIITNRENHTLFEILEELQVDTGLFEKIQSSDDTDYDKPHPRVFDDFLIRYKAKEMLYVGDHHEADYRAAHGAGIHFVGVLSGGISTRKDFLNAGVSENMILDSIADLPAILGL